MAGSSSSSKGEFVIPIGTGRSEEKDSSNYKDPKAAIAEKPDDNGVAPTSSHQQQQHSTNTNDEISSSDYLPSSVRESRPLEEEEEEEEEEKEVLEVQVTSLKILAMVMSFLSVGAFITSAFTNVKIHILEFELWKWCLLLMVIFLGIDGIITYLRDCRIGGSYSNKMIRDLAGDSFHSNKMIHDLVLDFVRDNLVSVLILIVFIVWMSLLNRRVSSKTAALILRYITKTLAALLIGSCLWTLKTVLVVTVASKFRIKDFLEKIADALSNKYLLKALSRPPPVMGPMTQEEDAAAFAGGPHRASRILSVISEMVGRWPAISIITYFLLLLFDIPGMGMVMVPIIVLIMVRRAILTPQEAAAGIITYFLFLLLPVPIIVMVPIIVLIMVLRATPQKAAADGPSIYFLLLLFPVPIIFMVPIIVLIMVLKAILTPQKAAAGGPHFSFSFSFLPKRDKMYGLVVSEGSKGVEELRACVKRLITKKENKIIKGVSYRTLLFLTHNVLETELSIIDNPIDDDDIERQTDFKITNEWEAETAADQIFSNVAKTDPKYMNADELLRILPKEDVKTLHSQVHGTDDPSDGRISKIALRQWVLKVFREHKTLTSSSKYHKAVVKQLGQFLECVLVLLVFIIWLLLIGYPTPRIQLLLSLLLGASFIFGNTCKNIFEGIIYVVIMHPFDIGDLCVVDDGQVLVVEGGDIYTTAFSDVDTDEKVFYPNSLLCSKPIKNYTRSPDMKETLEIIIDNPGQQLQDQKEFIERRIVEYLKSQPKQWLPRPVLYEMKETVDAENLTIVLHCFRKMSLQNWKERVSQKNMLKKEIKKITEELLLEFSVAEQATSSR